MNWRLRQTRDSMDPIKENKGSSPLGNRLNGQFSDCTHRALIIIIIWHYHPLWVLAFSAKSLQVHLSLALSFQFLTFSLFRSSMTSSCHRCLGFPTGLVPIGFQSSSFLVDLAWSILWICPRINNNNNNTGKNMYQNE